jgi:hypothetical protein
VIPVTEKNERGVRALEVNGVVYHVPTVELMCDDLSS